MKNWLNYRDTISLEDNVPVKTMKHVLTAEELPKFGDMEEDSGSRAALPYLADVEPDAAA